MYHAVLGAIASGNATRGGIASHIGRKSTDIGHPLAVDPRYGEKEPLRVGDLWSGAPDPDTVVLDRTPLHAAALRIPHPGKRGWLWIESPLPDDMARCLDLLRAARRYA